MEPLEDGEICEFYNYDPTMHSEEVEGEIRNDYSSLKPLENGKECNYEQSSKEAPLYVLLRVSEEDSFLSKEERHGRNCMKARIQPEEEVKHRIIWLLLKGPRKHEEDKCKSIDTKVQFEDTTKAVSTNSTEIYASSMHDDELSLFKNETDPNHGRKELPLPKVQDAHTQKRRRGLFEKDNPPGPLKQTKTIATINPIGLAPSSQVDLSHTHTDQPTVTKGPPIGVVEITGARLDALVQETAEKLQKEECVVLDARKKLASYYSTSKKKRVVKKENFKTTLVDNPSRRAHEKVAKVLKANEMRRRQASRK